MAILPTPADGCHEPRPGFMVIRLPTGGKKAQLKEARAFLEAAQGRLKEIDSQGRTIQANLYKAQLEAENKDYEFAVAEYQRYRQLYAQGLVPKSEI